jgi:alpha-glucosidase
VEAPLERLPLFVRAGSVVPMTPVSTTGAPMQYVGERPMDQLTLHVYPGDGESQLYEDDGHTWAFQEGDYRLTRFTLATTGTPPSRLDLRRRATGPYESERQGFEVVVHGVNKLPRAVTVDSQPVEQCKKDDDSRAIHLHVGLFEHLVVGWV